MIGTNDNFICWIIPLWTHKMRGITFPLLLAPGWMWLISPCAGWLCWSQYFWFWSTFSTPSPPIFQRRKDLQQSKHSSLFVFFLCSELWWVISLLMRRIRYFLTLLHTFPQEDYNRWMGQILKTEIQTDILKVRLLGQILVKLLEFY